VKPWKLKLKQENALVEVTKTVEKKVATENIRGVQKRIKTWKYSTKEQMK
jgi:hypothetical protein